MSDEANQNTQRAGQISSGTPRLRQIERAWDRSGKAQWNSMAFVAAVAASVADAVADSVFSVADLADSMIRYEQRTLY